MSSRLQGTYASIAKILLVAILATPQQSSAQTATDTKASLQAYWSEQNYRQARRAATELAHKGDAIAQLLLGFIYEYGLDGHRDSTAATNWLQTASRSGLDIADIALADNISPEASASSTLKAFGYSYVRHLAPKAPAPFNLAPFTIGEPESRSDNLLFALQFNRKAALKEKLSWAFSNTASLLEEPSNQLTRNPFSLSLHYKQKALELEDPSILYEQGLMQKWGLNNSPEAKSAKEYFELASTKGHRESMVELGRLLIKEKSSHEETLRGLQLLEEGSQVDPGELEDFAELFHDGEKVEKDMSRALPLYIQAAENGARHSANEAGRFFEFGWVGKKDPTKAEQFYRLSAARGSYWGAYNLGRFLLLKAQTKEQTDKAIRWLEFSAHQENMRASLRLADLYEDGTQWVEPDPAKRTFWLEWAALHENADAHFAIGKDRIRRGTWQTDDRHFDEVWASFIRALALDNYESLEYLQTLLTTRAGPRYEPTTAIRLLESYHDQYPKSMLISARLKLSNMDDFHDPEESKRLIETYRSVTGAKPPHEYFHLLLLYPDICDDPVSEIKAKLIEIADGDASNLKQGNMWTDIFHSETIEEMRDILALNLAAKFPTLEKIDPRYTLKGRKQLIMIDPKLGGWLGGIYFEMYAKVVFRISPSGEVSSVDIAESNHPLAALIMRHTVERWRWEAASDPDTTEIPVSIRLNYNP